MKLEIGKLYSCEEYFLMLYPDKDTARAADAAASAAAHADHADEAASDAAFWTRRLGKPVSSLPNNTPILVLNAVGKFYEVLGGDRKGWIIYWGWLKIKEIE